MKIHMMLQGKGGVGKSTFMAILAQYLDSKEIKSLNVDTDPVNRTFSGFKALDVKPLELMSGPRIDPRNFDRLADYLLNDSDHDAAVIDNGAASFLPLAQYIAEMDLAGMLADANRELTIHTVITGGAGMADTLAGLTSLVQTFAGKAKIVVWLNPYFGALAANGKLLVETPAYTALKKKLAAEVVIPELNPDTFGRDLAELVTSRRTFLEAKDDESISSMARHRLNRIKNDLFERIELAGAA